MPYCYEAPADTVASSSVSEQTRAWHEVVAVLSRMTHVRRLDFHVWHAWIHEHRYDHAGHQISADGGGDGDVLTLPSRVALVTAVPHIRSVMESVPVPTAHAHARAAANDGDLDDDHQSPLSFSSLSSAGSDGSDGTTVMALLRAPWLHATSQLIVHQQQQA